jgi:hypothetical protein
VLVSLIFKDIRSVSFILSQRSISDPSCLTGSVSFDLSQFALQPRYYLSPPFVRFEG